MTCRIKQSLSGALFALGIFYSNAAQAQSCTPTLYLFRHAEDVDHKKPPPDQPTGLTAVGRTHANLYPMMINQLETVLGAQSPCPLQRVFAMWDRKVGTEVRGTPNPYQTALPLAQYVGKMLIPPMPYVPEMYFTDGSHTYYLCEYPSDSNCQTTPSFDRNALTKYGQDVNSHLYSYLSAYFQTKLHVSVAIFHTSQGMPSVSLALGVKPVIAICPNDGQQKCTQEIVPPYEDRVLGDCPLPIDASTSSAKCYANEYRLLGWPAIQRSSVNIFKYQNISQNVFVKHYQSISTDLTVNQNLLQVLEFSQCYNLDNTTQELSTADEYYCQYSGSLASNLDNANSATTETIGNGKPPLRLDKIKAKICYPPFISANKSFVADSFGHCL